MHSEWALLAVQSDGVRLQGLVPVAVLELLEVWARTVCGDILSAHTERLSR
jgi:hypothetical protein